jgi:hypothetical protein
MTDKRDDREIRVKVVEDGKVECMGIYGVDVCIGDFVQVYPRAIRLSVVQGVVKRITASSIVLENEENDVAVRFSEIKMVRKPKIQNKNQ